jgi:hypothetical protein
MDEWIVVLNGIPRLSQADTPEGARDGWLRYWPDHRLGSVVRRSLFERRYPRWWLPKAQPKQLDLFDTEDEETT